MISKIKYQFKAKVWKYEGPSGWYFVLLPSNISFEIRSQLKWQEEGWGRLKSTAKIKDFQWDTSIWFDTKLNVYILPLKAEVRKKSQLDIDMIIDVDIWI